MSTLKKKIVALATGLALIVMILPVAPVKALTAAELQDQINALMAELSNLRTQLTALEGGETTTPTVSGCTITSFDRNLSQGMSGDDVKCLQIVLNSNSATQVAASDVGSSGQETTYFGPLTKAGVVKFQEKYATDVLAPWGLTSGTGYVGSTTRAKLDELLSGGAVVPPAEEEEEVVPPAEEEEEEQPVTAEGLTVALADDTPAAAVLPSGSLYNSVLKVDFTAKGGSATVTGLTLTRGGLIANTSIEGVSVYDENGKRLGNIITALTAEGEAVIDFGADDLVVSSGATKALTVKINIATSSTSGTVNFSVSDVADVSVSGGVTVSGSFPVVGNTMSLADGSTSLGDVRVSARSVGGLTSSQAESNANANLEVGNTAYEIAKFRFTQNNSKEAIKLEQLVVYVEGTINEDKDLTNFKLYAPDGTLLASADKPVSRYLTLTLDSPYTINKGITKDLSLKVDIADGSTHYFRAQIQNDYDVMVKGATTGAYVTPMNIDGGAFVAGTSGKNDNSFFRIKVGGLTISKAADSASGNVSPGDQNISLAKFTLRAVGEKVELRKMGLYIKVATTTTGRTLTGTITVKDANTGSTYLSISADTSGVQNITAIDYDRFANSYQNLSSYIVIESGSSKTIEITGTTPSAATSGDTYQVAVGKFYAKRYSSNDYAILPNESNAYSANELSVSNVTLSINKNAAFSGVRLSKGTNKVQVGEFVFSASAADDIRVSTLKITMSTTTGVQNVYLTKEDGTQMGDIVGSPSTGGDTFSVNWSITKTLSKVVKVFADITSAAADGSVTAQVPTDGVSAYGVSSAKDASGPSSDITSNPITIGAATLTIKKSSSAPVSQIVLAGQSGVTLNDIEFEASFENLTLKGLTLQLESASTSLWSYTTSVAANISKVYLYDGSTLLNPGGTPLALGVAGITGMSVTLPEGTPKVLTVKADITGSGALTSKSIGGIKVASTSTTYLGVYSSTGIMSTGVTLTSSALSNNFLFTDAAPTVEAVSGWKGSDTARTGSGVAQEIVGKYTVTNSGARTMTLSELRLSATLSNISTTTDVVGNFRLYDISDILIATSTLYNGSFSGGVISQMAGATTTYVRFETGTYATQETLGAQEIAAGASKTYIVKADTNNIEAGESNAAQTTAKLTTNVGGSKGYDLTEVDTPSASSDETYWKDSYVIYKYTPSGGSVLSGLQACDSVPVYGVTLNF